MRTPRALANRLRRRGRFPKIKIPRDAEPEPPVPSETQIEVDMRSRGGTIAFDLSDDKWMRDPDAFWREFKHTGQILVPKDFRKWLIGQEEMVEELMLNLEEWVRKLKDIEVLERSGKADDKNAMKKFLRERPGPYLALPGEPGTGKSLLIKIGNQQLKPLYKKYDIHLNDVLLVPNPIDPKRPKVRYVPSPMGKEIVRTAEYASSMQGAKIKIIRSFLGFVMLIGVLMILTSMMLMVYITIYLPPDIAWFRASGTWLQWLLYGMLLLVFPLMVLAIMGMSGSSIGGIRKTGGAHLNSIPNLVVDNSGDPDLFVDVTSTNASSFFGAVQHDPYQSGGLGTGFHQRMQAGVIHHADKKMMYFDEFMNFLQNEKLVTEFLTPMEDGMYPIRGREWSGSEGNASLAGQTDTPLSTQFMIVAAMNYNAIPLLNHYTPLRDRFYYGNIKKSEDEIPDTPQNRIKIAQFLADETYRFKVPPLCSEAVRLVINHMRRRASSATYLKLQMRAYIQDIKKGGQLVWAKKPLSKLCPCGLEGEYQHAEHIYLAINKYAKPLEMQILDDRIRKRKPYMITQVKGKKVGVVNGLVVIGDPSVGQATGDVTEVASWARKLRDDEPRGDGKWNFVMTGVPQDSKDTWMANSIMTVITTINRLYGISLAKDYYTHVSFLQTDPKSVDGPSAGITMTLSLMSWLGDPRLPADERRRVPMRLDIPVTGTVENLGADDGTWGEEERGDVRVGPIGGVFEKGYGALKLGASGIVIPDENYNASFFDDFVFSALKVQHAGSVLGYFDLLRADRGVDA